MRPRACSAGECSGEVVCEMRVRHSTDLGSLEGAVDVFL